MYIFYALLLLNIDIQSAEYETTRTVTAETFKRLRFKRFVHLQSLR